LYRNRINAGEILLEEILKRGLASSLSFVFAVPRGGIEVAYPIAEGIGKRIVPVVVHKIPSSINEEFAIGAISVFGDITLNEYARNESEDYILKIKEEMLRKLKERVKFLGGEFDFNLVKGKEILVVDDGVATGETLVLAVESIREFEPSRTIIAIPVSSFEAYEKLSSLGEVICPLVDRYFYAVSEYYEEFSQLSDEEAKRYIEKSLNFESRRGPK
jgi:putative phosphoribosyl transferase